VVRRLIQTRRSSVVGFALLSSVTLALAWPHAQTPAVASPPSPPSEAITIPAEELPLAARIDAAIDNAKLDGTGIGISVVDLETGAVLYARAADVPLNPASNAKLVTTAAALAKLGPEHRYSTHVYVEENGLTDGVVSGKLYLQGGGDPALVTGEIYELAGQIEAAGITKLKGTIVVDSGRYADEGLPPGFDQKDEFASHRAPGGAMAVNYNTFEVHARPAKVIGETPVLSALPALPGIELESDALTVAGNRNKLYVSAEQREGKLVVTFHGEVGIDNGPSSYRYPVSDPSRYAGELLLMALRQRGIDVGKATVDRGEVPRNAKLVATMRSEALSELCRAVNKWSNNFMAEQILRSLAPNRGATADAALEQLRAYTVEIGMPQAGLVLGNGSGLYANNLISAAALTHLLAHVYDDFRYRYDFMASLAIMGADGTTRSRLRESEARGFLRVKTGTLDDVSALSGYAGARGRDPIAFAILINNLDRKQRARARTLQDELAELLAVEAAKSSTP
jgi:D-alanyl-D-alanine carboxypeptidase/D-alanyl-D-alanine-endopeptidase (penicillin-binding protein 4)